MTVHASGQVDNFLAIMPRERQNDSPRKRTGCVMFGLDPDIYYSTVTDLAKLRGLSGSFPLSTAQ